MTQQSIWKNILVASAAIIVGGLTVLMSDRNPKIVLAGCAVGGTGAIFASKKFCLQFKEELERDITIKVRESLTNDINPERQHELKDFIDDFQEKLEQKLSKIAQELSILAEFQPHNLYHQNILSNLDNKFENFEKLLQDLEQDITKQVKQEMQVAVETYKPQGENPQQPIPPNPPSTDTQKKELSEVDPGYQVIQWLNNRGIKVEKYRSKKESILEETFNKLAIYLGENYAILDEFHKKLKKSVQNGSEFSFSLKKRAQTLEGEERKKYFDVNTKLGSMLKDAGFLSSYHYNKNTKVLKAAVHCRSDFKNFLSGDYFERFIFDKITKYFRSKGLSYDYLVNAKVMFPNTDRYELDLLFLVKEHLFWIECKSGSNLNSIEPDISKYSENHHKFLQIPKTNALLVCQHFNEKQAATRTNLWQHVTVTNPESILKLIKSTLDGTVNQETTESNKCLV